MTSIGTFGSVIRGGKRRNSGEMNQPKKKGAEDDRGSRSGGLPYAVVYMSIKEDKLERIGKRMGKRTVSSGCRSWTAEGTKTSRKKVVLNEMSGEQKLSGEIRAEGVSLSQRKNPHMKEKLACPRGGGKGENSGRSTREICKIDGGNVARVNRRTV